MDLHDPAPDEALNAALADLGPAASEAVQAIEAAALAGDWGAALAAIEALAGAAGNALEPAIYAALLAGGARVGDRLPVSVSVPSQQPASPSPFPPGVAAGVVESELASLPEGLRGAFLQAMGRRIPELRNSGISTETLPLAQRAAEALRSKNLVTPDEFKRLSDEAKQRSLMVAGVVRQEALAKLQPLLTEQALAPSLPAFKRRLQEEGLADSIAGNHVETAFRDAVQTAYSDGMDRLLDDPVVGEAFPYIERLPIRDSRLSKVCGWASRAGINGTGIYRRDDPSWRLVRPPSHPNCRCGQNPLTKEMAEERGITTGRHVTLPELLLKLLRR